MGFARFGSLFCSGSTAPGGCLCPTDHRPLPFHPRYKYLPTQPVYPTTFPSLSLFLPLGKNPTVHFIPPYPMPHTRLPSPSTLGMQSRRGSAPLVDACARIPSIAAVPRVRRTPSHRSRVLRVTFAFRVFHRSWASSSGPHDPLVRGKFSTFHVEASACLPSARSHPPFPFHRHRGLPFLSA